ncbi:MAG: DUF4097 family beta strand repeat-containing protein [Thermoflexibacter sp.]
MKTAKKYLLIALSYMLAVNIASAQNTIDQVDTSYEGVSKLIVKGSFCDVTLLGGNSGNTVAFTGKITGTENNRDFRIMHRLSGGVLEVWIDRPESRWNMGWNNLNGKLDFKVPSKIELVVSNSSGDVFAQDLSGSICEVGATSGNVKVKNIQTNLRITATSGDLRAEMITGQVRAKTTSGNQQFYEVVGNIEADATSGDIRIKKAEGDIEATSTSGEINLEDTKGILNLRSTSGDIEGREVFLTGNANFKSTSGAIDIRLKNKIQDLTFDLEASSGNLKAGGVRGDKRLYVKNGEGNIKIRGVSSSGNQNYSE